MSVRVYSPAAVRATGGAVGLRITRADTDVRPVQLRVPNSALQGIRRGLRFLDGADDAPRHHRQAPTRLPATRDPVARTFLISVPASPPNPNVVMNTWPGA